MKKPQSNINLNNNQNIGLAVNLKKSNRIISFKYSNSPGPGQYNPKKEVYSKIGGLVSHHLKSAFLDPLTPGPGAY